MEDNFFENFTHSVAAARLLLTQAHERGSLIEGLVLYASAIDALLRNLVALKTGDRQGTTMRLDPRYFYHDDTKWMNERQVYAAAHSCDVLTDPEFSQLEELYKFRNVIIHRFIISGVTYDQIASKLDQYEVIYGRILERLKAIEQPDGEELTDVEIAESRLKVARKLGESSRARSVPAER
jgi:hypothetical protein